MQETDRQIAALDKLLDNHYKDYNFESVDSEEYVSNPINTYVLLKRTGVFWPKTKQVLFKGDDGNETDSFESVAEVIGALPTQEDMEGAANGIFLLQVNRL